MIIEKDKFVAIHYTLKDDDGNVLDSSVDSTPLAYLHGNGMLIPGLEKQIEGKSEGDKFSATVPPEEAYGIYDERLVAKIDRDRFVEGSVIEVGMQFQMMTPAGPTIVTVKEVNGNEITVDGNHQLADKTLHFEIEVVEVRDPSEEELARFQGNGGGCGGCGGGCGGCGGDCGGNCDGDCGGDCNCENGGCGGEGGCGNC